MSARKIYWRNREGEFPPDGAQFFWRPFQGDLVPLGSCVKTVLPSPIQCITHSPPCFIPEFEAWKRAVLAALGQIEKVVLARKCELSLPTAPNPFAITAALEPKAEGACLFCVEMENFSFLGASPERLFVREGRRIETEAVAGTRKRGHSPEEDRRLKEELLGSAKDLREIAPVQAHLTEALWPLVEERVCFSPIVIHETHHVQHLYSRCVAVLKGGISDAELIERLHPTPALAGMPPRRAMEMIAQLEPFSRGLYGGVLGWQTAERSEWVVAIRCCLLEKKRATLFSGTGIVEGSEPDAEWEELNQKLRLYEGIFL